MAVHGGIFFFFFTAEGGIIVGGVMLAEGDCPQGTLKDAGKCRYICYLHVCLFISLLTDRLV